ENGYGKIHDRTPGMLVGSHMHTDHLAFSVDPLPGTKGFGEETTYLGVPGGGRVRRRKSLLSHGAFPSVIYMAKSRPEHSSQLLVLFLYRILYLLQGALQLVSNLVLCHTVVIAHGYDLVQVRRQLLDSSADIQSLQPCLFILVTPSVSTCERPCQGCRDP